MPSAKLIACRAAIDDIDAKLVVLLAQRFSVVDDVILEKRAAGLPSVLPDRVEQVVAQVRALAAQHKLDPNVTERLWRVLIAETCGYEDALLKFEQ